jgi:hypothetical protein
MFTAAHRPIRRQLWGCTDAGISPQLSWSGLDASSSGAVVGFTVGHDAPAAGQRVATAEQ